MDRETMMDLISDDCKQYIDKIIEVYDAPFARDLGIEIEHISKDEVCLYLDVMPKHINSRGYLHGAVIYGIMDHSLAFAANMEEEAVGQSSNIIYHRPVKEGRIHVRTVLINRSRSLCIYDSRVFCNEKLIASCTLTAFRLGDKR